MADTGGSRAVFTIRRDNRRATGKAGEPESGAKLWVCTDEIAKVHTLQARQRREKTFGDEQLSSRFQFYLVGNWGKWPCGRVRRTP